VSDVFITQDFVLQNPTAVALYHEYARDLPIIDYHCHLPPRDVADDRHFENLTRIWLAGDHYKWRAMRTAGVDERYITGDALDWEKFERWAETVPKTLRSPLYHWTHLELKRPLGISDRLLSPATARGIWDECAAKLAQPSFSARGIMRQMRVVLVCTTDDPTDDLAPHARLRNDPTFDVQVLPTFRPDRSMAVENPTALNAWTEKLAAAADVEIRDFDAFLEAIRRRHDFFHAAGCRLSDHGIETFYAEERPRAEIVAIFNRVRRGSALGPDEILAFKSAMLHELALLDHEKGWVQQFHFGAMRNNSTRMFKRLGPDTGYDSIGDFPVAQPMTRFFDRLDREDRLAKTIIYNLNPADNEIVATMLGNFQDGRTPGKMQMGSGWWFLDTKDGIEKQLEALSNMGLLSHFVGMLTDSRSFLSYTRHEYYRRILCNVLGTEMERGLLPRDMELVGSMIRDICYRNAARYFGFDLPAEPA
jgi:glucuronate isomerase